MSARQQLSRLRESVPAILPSLLLCDFGNLEREVRRLEEAGVKALHLDVMDGHFVPNLTYGMPVVAALRRLTDMPLDVHLMISNPERYVTQFHEAGADVITFHVEAVADPRPVLESIRGLDTGAGIALNPGTPLEAVTGCLDLCDLVLVMSVNAGFGGQQFNSVALDKLTRLKKLVSAGALLQVDGGINETTIARCAEAGGQLFVVGSAIFGSDSYESTMHKLTELATS